MALLFWSCAVQAEVPSSKDAAPEAPGGEVRALQRWFENDLHFFIDGRGSAKLFLRRQPVKAAILADPFPIKNEVTYLIAKLSDAAGVSHEITMRDVNLAIVVDSPINDGDKPDARLWRKVGLSEGMYQIVSAQGNWASGCGIYSFANKDGQVSLSIVFADSKLGSAQVKDCVIEGVIRGFGLRESRKLVMRADDGYIQYITLAKAFTACEKKIGIERLFAMGEAEQRSKYIECVSEFLSRL
ncbi:hypothetical protein [Bradyrhizobium lablabi]|nr:hypothetical protein [Bradyrhizobium lablabi]